MIVSFLVSDPVLSASSLDEADALRLAGRHKQAQQAYGKILSTLRDRADWPAAMAGLAESQLKQKHYRRAAETYEKLAADFPADARAPEAVWNALRIRTGPMRDRSGALKLARQLAGWTPQTAFNERGLYMQAVLLHWEKQPGRARAVLRQYLFDYKDGTYAEAAQKLLDSMGG